MFLPLFAAPFADDLVSTNGEVLVWNGVGWVVSNLEISQNYDHCPGKRPETVLGGSKQITYCNVGVVVDDDDDQREIIVMIWMLRRKMMKLRNMMLKRKTDPNTGKHTLCEPAQSK